jgi:FkbM family methyltransferase
VQAKAWTAAAINYRGARRPVFRGVVFDLLGRTAQGIAVDGPDGWYFVPTRDWVGRSTFMYGSFDSDAMRTAVEIIEHMTGNHPIANLTFLDVGANIGTSTVLAFRRFHAYDAVAFEPHPKNFRFLRCNLVANDISEKTRPVQSALSDRCGSIHLQVSSDNSGDHRVRLDQAPGLGDSIDVPVTTLDRAGSDLDLDYDRIGLAWIDIQGHEGHMLAGASSLLARGTPTVVEYSPLLLRQAGGFELFHSLVADHYRTVIDVRGTVRRGDVQQVRAQDVAQFAACYSGENYTDLVLLP